MLCSACSNIFVATKSSAPVAWNGNQPVLFTYPELKDTWVGPHHSKPNAFLSAVSERCYPCSTIHRDLSPLLRQQASFCRTFYLIRHLKVNNSEKSPQDHYELEFMFEFSEGREPLPKEQAFRCTGIFLILPENEIISQQRLPLAPNTFSGQCEKRVRDWHKTCRSSHTRCRDDWRTEDNRPSRLLKIQDQSRFQLEQINNDLKCPLYVTLSHCWPPSELPFKLTIDSLPKMIQGMLISELPKRFQDAMEIARWLGHEYIWIDAYCIIQNSDDDWLEQSSKMGDIYAGSSCNIAATRESADAGCFTSRFTAMVEPYLIANPVSEDLALTHVIGYNDFWSNSLLDTRLNNRCWVIQERLLAPRTIHFGQEQIFWECRCEMACEAYPDGIPDQFRNHKTLTWRALDKILSPDPQPEAMVSTERVPFLTMVLKYLSNLVSGTVSKPIVITPFEIYRTWSRIVERYMECNLSLPKDKLVAISGIAQKVAAATHEPYLAGLWHNDRLSQSLLWFVLGRRQADSTASIKSPSWGTAGYRAPSWSWASLEAKLVWNWSAECSQVLLKIINVEVVPQKGSKMGGVVSAKLDVCGNLFKGNVGIVSRCEDGTPDEDGRYSFKFRKRKMNKTGSKVLGENQPVIEPAIYLDTPMMPKAASFNVYLLPVCTDWNGRPGRIMSTLAGLLLRKSESLDTAYERIGIFGMNQDQINMLKGTRSAALDNFDDLLAVGKTAITLV